MVSKQSQYVLSNYKCGANDYCFSACVDKVGVLKLVFGSASG